MIHCPECGVWTTILESRTRKSNETRRRYMCANEHRFTTIETIVDFRAGSKTVAAFSRGRTEVYEKRIT